MHLSEVRSKLLQEPEAHFAPREQQVQRAVVSALRVVCHPGIRRCGTVRETRAATQAASTRKQGLHLQALLQHFDADPTPDTEKTCMISGRMRQYPVQDYESLSLSDRSRARTARR